MWVSFFLIADCAVGELLHLTALLEKFRDLPAKHTLLSCALSISKNLLASRKAVDKHLRVMISSAPTSH